MGDSENKELVGQDEPKKTGNVENEPKKNGGRIQKLKSEFKKIIWPDKNTVIKIGRASCRERVCQYV